MLESLFARLDACFSQQADGALPLTLLPYQEFSAWHETQSAQVQAQLHAARVTGGPGQLALLSDQLLLLVDPASPLTWLDPLTRTPDLPAQLQLPAQTPQEALLGFGLSAYRYSQRTSKTAPNPPQLVCPSWPRAGLQAHWLAMELVNLPAAELGPAEFAQVAQAVANLHGAQLDTTEGEALVQGYPAIHAVGKGAEPARAPRLVRLSHGATDAKPHLALVGKGVVFDTGGLNLKPASSMRNMKKDMGGAAHALALAHWLLADGFAGRLDVWLPLVENCTGPAAMRPGDILATRKGLSVEVGHTDAEGRLILADAMTRAAEESPDLMIDLATLTGAARVALGPELPPYFSNDEGLASTIWNASAAQQDPLWRLPLHRPYRAWIEPDVADLTNSGSQPFAGAITAALFLESFVPDGLPWAHFDLFAWSIARAPSRPKGGAAQGLRALHAVLSQWP